jgi:hypothetical protein
MNSGLGDGVGNGIQQEGQLKWPAGEGIVVGVEPQDLRRPSEVGDLAALTPRCQCSVSKTHDIGRRDVGRNPFAGNGFGQDLGRFRTKLAFDVLELTSGSVVAEEVSGQLRGDPEVVMSPDLTSGVGLQRSRDGVDHVAALWWDNTGEEDEMGYLIPQTLGDERNGDARE